MTIAFHMAWLDQCEAAQGIKSSFGSEKALGYLIGEKFLNYLEASATRRSGRARSQPSRLRSSGSSSLGEIGHYFETVKRVGALGHDCSDEAFRDAGAIEESPVEGATQILLLEQAKELLLE